MVKKAKVFAKRVLKNRLLPFALLFVAGLGLGWAVGHNRTTPPESTDTRSQQTRAETTAQKRQEQQTKRLERTYDRAKESVVRDQKAGKLTQQQVDLLNGKLDEIYEFKKNAKDETVEDKTAISKKRAEWRKWAEDNKVPKRYFAGL